MPETEPPAWPKIEADSKLFIRENLPETVKNQGRMTIPDLFHGVLLCVARSARGNVRSLMPRDSPSVLEADITECASAPK